MESSILSPNRNLYGDLHNMGQVHKICESEPDFLYASFSLPQTCVHFVLSRSRPSTLGVVWCYGRFCYGNERPHILRKSMQFRLGFQYFKSFTLAKQRWHAYVDDIFQEHKESLTAYTTTELDYPGVQVTGVTIQNESGEANNFQTFWQQSDVDFSRGMDFVPRGSVFAR